ncbi:hypothetical protein DBR06_SOUSAS2010017, partial [Sousa chinensis]
RLKQGQYFRYKTDKGERGMPSRKCWPLQTIAQIA